MRISYKTKPYPHQEYGVELYKKIGNLGLLWEMGAGKTKGMIDILRNIYQDEGKLQKTLIISPLVTLFNWKNEFKMHSYIDQNDIFILHKGGTKGKMRDFKKGLMNKNDGSYDGVGIVITNYESLNSQDFYDMVAEWAPEVMILDEAHLIKNHKAKRSKAAVKLGDKAKHNFVLTGTPILNSVKDIFMLFRFLDGGKTFGRNFHVFLNTYMEDENAGWANKQGHFPKLVPRVDKFAELTRLIYTKCHRVLKKDVLKDLPPLVKMVRHVELGKKQKQYYKEMSRDFIAFVQEKQKSQELSGAVVAQLAVTKALRLQQICSGYVTTEDGTEIEIEDNPRLVLVEELLQEIVLDNNNKCILWCSFRNNYKQLSKLCEKMGIGHVMLTGDQNLTQKRESMDAFNNEKEVKVIISNRRAGGIGINLVAASYSIVYSRNFSLGEELQSEARNHRGGSEIHSQIVKIDLCAKDTIDENVLEALRNKDDISKRVVDFVKETL